jgi:golgin subfamily B member 1
VNLGRLSADLVVWENLADCGPCTIFCVNWRGRRGQSHFCGVLPQKSEQSPIALTILDRHAGRPGPESPGMSKPEATDRARTESRRGISSRQSTDLAAATRIDAAHEIEAVVADLPAAEATSAAQRVPDESSAAQVRLQAEQLAAHLRARQEELDHRAAQLNSQIAKWESEGRAARLWLSESENDLMARGQRLAKQEEELAARREAIVRRGQELAKQQEAVALRERELSEQQKALCELEQERSKQQEAICGRHEASPGEEAELSQQRRAFAEEVAAARQQMAAQRRQAAADVEQQRQAVQRRADHVDRCGAALGQLRGELARMQRETLEIRLATEELWVQLSGVAPPARLVQSLGRIRSKLAEQYAQANAELAEQKRDLEAIRDQLLKQHENLVREKRRFDQWASGQQMDCQEQASRLAARERQIEQAVGCA